MRYLFYILLSLQLSCQKGTNDGSSKQLTYKFKNDYLRSYQTALYIEESEYERKSLLEDSAYLVLKSYRKAFLQRLDTLLTLADTTNAYLIDRTTPKDRTVATSSYGYIGAWISDQSDVYYYYVTDEETKLTKAAYDSVSRYLKSSQERAKNLNAAYDHLCDEVVDYPMTYMTISNYSVGKLNFVGKLTFRVISHPFCVSNSLIEYPKIEDIKNYFLYLMDIESILEHCCKGKDLGE